MKRSILIIVSLFFALAIPAVSSAGVSINIGIPSPFVFASPPDVVVVPSGDAYVYMVPGTVGLYFYDDWWYRFDRGRWFRSRAYDGQWFFVESNRVPRYVVDVPPDYYRHIPRGYLRIHYRDFHRHWKSWNRDRHWNRYDWYKREHRERETRMRRHYPEFGRHKGDMHRERREERREERRDSGRHKRDGGRHDRGGDDRGGHGGRR